MSTIGRPNEQEKIKIAANKAMNSSVVKRWQTSINSFVGFTFNVELCSEGE